LEAAAMRADGELTKDRPESDTAPPRRWRDDDRAVEERRPTEPSVAAIEKEET
jgi:hypothetical protein